MQNLLCCVFCTFRMRYPPYTEKNVQMGKRLVVPKEKKGSGYFTYLLLACVVAAVIGVLLKVSDWYLCVYTVCKHTYLFVCGCAMYVCLCVRVLLHCVCLSFM